jgi:hypothetical protein
LIRKSARKSGAKLKKANYKEWRLSAANCCEFRKIPGVVAEVARQISLTDLLGVDADTVKKVLASWGPGRFDAALDKDGKGFRPDGKQAGTLNPPAFGLAGVNLHTWTGFGSVPYWNAYVGEKT